jgi:hypothetical protein
MKQSLRAVIGFAMRPRLPDAGLARQTQARAAVAELVDAQR